VELSIERGFSNPLLLREGFRGASQDRHPCGVCERGRKQALEDLQTQARLVSAVARGDTA
jgi:hypothetical protein